MAERRPDEAIVIVGAERRYWGDWYQMLLRAPWSVTVAVVTCTFLILNVLFALAYQVVDGVAGANSFADRFFFSVQTMGTIGYGAMYPASIAAHVLTTCEALAGIFVVALATGLVFSKFSIVRARVRFSDVALITPMNGVPTLMLRVGNERESRVVDACIRVTLSRRELTHEGVEMWRVYDLHLERERAMALSRAWLVMHVIRPGSPLHGCTAESLAADEVELVIAISGADETSGQNLHAQQTYEDKDIRWNMRFADMLTRDAQGTFTLDLKRFDELVDMSGALALAADRKPALAIDSGHGTPE
jgi:inward rectifier potassium channel